MLGDALAQAAKEADRRGFDLDPRRSFRDSLSVTGEGMDRRSFIRSGILLPPVFVAALSSACSAPAPTAPRRTAPASETARPASQQANPIQNLIVFKSPIAVFRVLSAGKSRDVTRSVEMVVQKQGQQGIGRPRVFSWKEL